LGYSLKHSIMILELLQNLRGKIRILFFLGFLAIRSFRL